MSIESETIEFTEGVVSLMERLVSAAKGKDFRFGKEERADYEKLIGSIVTVGMDNVVATLVAITNFALLCEMEGKWEKDDCELFNFAKEELFADWITYNRRLAAIINSKGGTK